MSYTEYLVQKMGAGQNCFNFWGKVNHHTSCDLTATIFCQYMSHNAFWDTFLILVIKTSEALRTKRYQGF